MSQLTSAAIEISFHNEGALVLLRLGGEAAAQGFDNLVLDEFAAGAPAARAGELLGAAAQAAKTQAAGRLPEMEPEFVAQAGEEKKFEAVARFAGEQAEGRSEEHTAEIQSRQYFVC